MRITVEVEEMEPRDVGIDIDGVSITDIVIQADSCEKARDALQMIGLACAKGSAVFQADIDDAQAAPPPLVGMDALIPRDAITGEPLSADTVDTMVPKIEVSKDARENKAKGSE